ncbi:MAG: hypothetical protein PHY48_01930 [Candidatus Cloacimonetes bacterium]|nr:hypothetical protein [Candidatus Cloacimonadota bacterium]
MEIVDAYWDTDSLGVKTYELTLHDESIGVIIDKITELKSEGGKYIVVKAPVLRPDIYKALSDEGLSFVEAQLSIKLTKRRYLDICPRYEKIFEPSEMEVVTNSSQLEEIVNLFGDSMFTTDRIAMHPKFGFEYANKRYKNWLKSSYGKPGIILYRSFRKNQISGFGMHKIDGLIVDGLLGGVFEKFQKEGYFASGLYANLSHYFNQGYRSFKTTISSNNKDVFRIYEMLGFQVTRIQYVFHTVDW